MKIHGLPYLHARQPILFFIEYFNDVSLEDIQHGAVNGEVRKYNFLIRSGLHRGLFSGNCSLSECSRSISFKLV